MHSFTNPLADEARASSGISVILPTFQEAKRIGRQLAMVRQVPHIDEVILVDGQSSDDTVGRARAAIARTLGAPVRVTAGPRGRGKQLNAGAALAQFDTLLFLHADVQLPINAGQLIHDALADKQVCGGAFRTHTVPDEPAASRSFRDRLRHRAFALADVRSRLSPYPYGDQAVFVRRREFRCVGGFPDQPLMEDYELARRLWRRGRLVRVDATVEVSGRRLEQNWPLHLLMWNAFPTLYRLGVPAEQLAAWYGHVR